MHILDEAADLIEAYIGDLNTSNHTCECCGHRRYEDFAAYGTHTQLSAMIRKIRAIAARES